MAEGTGGIPATAIAITVVGIVLAYSGIKGKGIASEARTLLAGKDPSTAAQTNAIANTQTADAGLPDASTLTSDGTKGAETFGAQTYGQFFTAVLNDLGRPVTTGNLEALAGIVHEEGQNDYFNPMNIEYHSGGPVITKGVSDFNSVGVQRYGSFDAGVGATVALLQEPHWAGVTTALLSGSFTLVQAAISHAYSWAAYRTVTPAQADQILATTMGNGSGA